MKEFHDGKPRLHPVPPMVSPDTAHAVAGLCQVTDRYANAPTYTFRNWGWRTYKRRGPSLKTRLLSGPSLTRSAISRFPAFPGTGEVFQFLEREVLPKLTQDAPAPRETRGTAVLEHWMCFGRKSHIPLALLWTASLKEHIC